MDHIDISMEHYHRHPNQQSTMIHQMDVHLYNKNKL